MDKAQFSSFLRELQKKGSALGLERIQKMLSLLGNPHLSCKTIHVAGTNGKGSTATMIAALLQAADLSVGLYTSPHLTEFNERIKVNGQNILDEELFRLADELKAVMEKNAVGLTYFEFCTALAFRHFAGKKLDFAVIEVGLGGRLDATNVVTPDVCVITNISLEHVQELGNSLASIAKEKAGIIKENSTLVTTEKNPQMLELFRKTCREKKSEFIEVKKRFNGKLALLGEHQRWNAAAAVAAIKALGIDVKTEALQELDFPGRFQIIKNKATLVLDCAHNPAGMLALKNTFEQHFPGKKAVLVIGMCSNKDLQASVETIAPIASKAIAVQAKETGIREAVPAEKIAEELKKHIADVKTVSSVAVAVKAVSSNEIVLVAGSCYVVGEALAALKAY